MVACGFVSCVISPATARRRQSRNHTPAVFPYWWRRPAQSAHIGVSTASWVLVRQQL